MLSVIKMVRYVPKGWVVGVVVWGMASGVFGNEEWGVVITKAEMDPILMQGGSVVKGEDYSIEVSYAVQCKQCGKQNIRFVLSDNMGNNACGLHAGFPGFPAHTKLSSAFSTKYEVDSQSLTMDNFSWSEFVEPKGTSIITLKNIKKKPEAFYVWVEYHDYYANYPGYQQCYAYLPVTITEESKDKVRISGLEDATLNDEGTYTLDNICVYSSNGEVQLSFNGGDPGDENEFFALRNSNDERIPYTIRVASKQNQKTPNTYKKDGRAGGYWPANDKAEDCNNIPNMTFTIQADKQTMNAVSAGEYIDTMTVTVEPK